MCPEVKLFFQSMSFFIHKWQVYHHLKNINQGQFLKLQKSFPLSWFFKQNINQISGLSTNWKYIQRWPSSAGVEFTYMLAVFVGWPSSLCVCVFPQIAVFLCCMQPCALCVLWIAVLHLVDCDSRWLIIRTSGWGQMMEQNWPCHNALELRRPSFARREESLTEKVKCKNLSDT